MEWSSTLRIYGVVFAALLALLLWSASRPRRGEWWRWLPSMLAGIVAAGFLWLVNRWDLSSVHLRTVYPALYVVALCIGLFRSREPAARAPRTRGRLARDGLASVFNLAIVVLLAPALLSGLRAYLPNEDGIDLASPFASGDTVVVQGGDDATINHHASVPAQRHALDIGAVNAWGFSQTPRREGALTDYVVFGEALVAPCEGSVRAALDGQPDKVAGNPDADGDEPEDRLARLAGNHVVLECDGLLVLIAHLREGSVVPEVGQSVRIGDPVGAIGNSGNTTEPHLHLHVARHADDPLADDAEGVPFTIEGRSLVRGSRVPGA